jgi:outer membrane protein OmpA-like peptidoglycan-associated protein
VRVLGQFATTLQQNQVTQVAIIGHTDSTGSDAINNPLSFDRANATRDYLVSRGVAASRIATDGRGSREPIADNSTPAGRAMNRRVEIYVAEPAS